MMGGEIDWQGVDVLAAVAGIDDVDLLVRGLLAVRERQRKVQELSAAE